MSFRVQAMAGGLPDATQPRRFDLTMSRRTRRPAAASFAANFHQEDTEASRCLCLSDHLKSRNSEDTEVHEASARSEATEESETQQHQQQECHDDSRRFSLQELIHDETGAIDGEKDAATGGHEDDPAADAVAQGVAGAAATRRPEEHVAGRKVIGMMRRYVRVRSIKTKHAPEKNLAPVC